MNRRQFLSLAPALALSGGAARGETYDQQKVRRVGIIGPGWYGKSDLFRLVQVSPIEIVSMCDVDSVMLDNAAKMAAERQKSHKTPRVYKDYRKMLAEKDLDIVLVATPDHWHALAMIEAVKSGADVYVQKPISVDVTEGRAMLAAARKYNRVVQVGTQRRSTPHLVEARENIVKAGLLGKIAYADVYCYYHMRNTTNPPDSAPPSTFDYEMWTGPAPMRPYNKLVHPRTWRAFTEYGNGIMGDMCIHMFDMVRWMLDLGWPERISASGGIYVDKGAKANIPDTQSATFDYGNMQINWEMRSWGDAPDAKYPWGATIYGEKGTLKASVNGYDFIPVGKGTPIRKDVTMELDQYPEDKTEKDLEKPVAPAIRHHMMDFLAAIDARSRPVADIEQGHISTASCILANNAMKLGRTLRYDPVKHQVVGDPEANKLLARPYRAPWVHPV